MTWPSAVFPICPRGDPGARTEIPPSQKLLSQHDKKEATCTKARMKSLSR